MVFFFGSVVNEIIKLVVIFDGLIKEVLQNCREVKKSTDNKIDILNFSLRIVANAFGITITTEIWTAYACITPICIVANGIFDTPIIIWLRI